MLYDLSQSMVYLFLIFFIFFHSVMQSDEFEQQNAKTITPQQTIATAVT